MINGQKVWTSFAQYATRCVLLTRTGPGHAGITAFFVDMDSPGIDVRPLRTMHGVDEFCEVYFDHVSSCQPTECSEGPVTVGNSRWTCCRSSARRASGNQLASGFQKFVISLAIRVALFNITDETLPDILVIMKDLVNAMSLI